MKMAKYETNFTCYLLLTTYDLIICFFSILSICFINKIKNLEDHFSIFEIFNITYFFIFIYILLYTLYIFIYFLLNPILN